MRRSTGIIVVLMACLLAMTSISLHEATLAHAQEAANDVFTAGGKFTHITSATNTQIKALPGVLHSITINTATAVGIVTVVDTSVAACTGGTTIAIIAAADVDQTFLYDVQFNNGLCITTAGASDLTVSSR